MENSSEDSIVLHHDTQYLHLLWESNSSEINVSRSPPNSNTRKNITITKDLIENLNRHNIIIIDSKYKSNEPKNTYTLYTSVLKPIFEVLGIKFTYYKTSSPDSIQEIANTIDHNISKQYLILFISGDTTIFELINFVYSKYQNNLSEIPQITVQPFPHGTGNALSISMGATNDLLAIEKLFEFNKTHLPLYQLSSNTNLNPVNPILKHLQNKNLLFMIVSSWCLHSTLVYESDKPELRNNYGSERFRIAANKILKENPVFKAKLKFLPDGKPYTYNEKTKSWTFDNSNENFSKLSYLVVAGVSNFEKTFKISPDSKISSDELHLITIPYLPSDTTISLMDDAYNNGVHVRNPLVGYETICNGKTLQVEIDDSMSSDLSIICLDGSSWEVTGSKRVLSINVFDKSFLHFLS